MLTGADAAFANAEFSCPRPATPPAPRRFVTAVRPEILDELRDLNVRLVSFANNHTGDFGPQGVVDTLEAAEARNLVPAGIGRSLYEARSARFLDTPRGRIGIVAASTTRAADFLASAPGSGIAARPGLNPLRFGRAYVLPQAEFEQLRRIDELLGTAASRQEVIAVEVMRDPGPDVFNFGSVFEGSLRIERGERAQVRYFMDERDAKAILDNVRDAANRADCVLMSLHTHEGERENWYAPRPASFVEDFAHRAIDAGAHAVLGHGAHMLRGVEIYKGRPIFYNLNSLLMEFEAGEQRMTPEMYEGLRLRATTRCPRRCTCRACRTRTASASASTRTPSSRALASRCATSKATASASSSCRSTSTSIARGPPTAEFHAIASPEIGREIADDMARLSEFWGTRMQYDEADGTISVARVNRIDLAAASR